MAKTNWLLRLVVGVACLQPGVAFCQKAKGNPKTPPPWEFKPAFLLTIYYTPMEAGFTTQAGFDPTATTTTVIDGTTYGFQSNFLGRVRIEGWGQILNGTFLTYAGSGTYGFSAGPPLGSRGNPLSPRGSCAADNNILPYKSVVRVLSSLVKTDFENNLFSADDVGGGISGYHLDLYWGIDNPRSAAAVSFPAGTNYPGESGVRVARLK